MIGIVALVVIGPERLPRVARTAGLLLGRMRRYVSDIKADIDREMQLEELKRLKDEMQESARELERSFTSEIQSIEQSARAIVSDAPEASATKAVDSPTGESLPAAAETQKPALGIGKE